MYLACNRKINATLFNSKLVDDLIYDFGLIAPFYHYLQKLK